jgi:TetR/AcrR family transcriptional repressor of lmrAB and yxaGH operons
MADRNDGTGDSRSPRRSPTRAKLVTAAHQLIRRHGYAGTGLNDVIAESGAPKGSLYHHFPAGKEELAAAAVRQSATGTRRSLTGLAEASASAADLVRAQAKGLVAWLEGTEFTEGCAIAATTAELQPDMDRLAQACREGFAGWRDPYAARLRADGCDEATAARLADFVTAGMEGALLLARAERSCEPLRNVAEEIARHLGRATVR